MGQFLYHFPGLQGNPSRKVLEDLGLAGSLGESRQFAEMNGPQGSGVMVRRADEGDETKLRFNPSAQKWLEWKGFSVGYWLESKPGPQELLREKSFAGHWADLTDGTRWIIPVARRYWADHGERAIAALGDPNPFPKTVVMTPSGEVEQVVKGEFSKFTEAAEREWRCFLWEQSDEKARKQLEFEKPEPHSLREQFGLATDLLALNYRLGPAEVSLLELLDTETLPQVLRSFIDVPTMLKAAEALKKNGGDSMNESKPSDSISEESDATSQPGEMSS